MIFVTVVVVLLCVGVIQVLDVTNTKATNIRCSPPT